MLIDEAFNGKGLDEVVYSFQPNLSGHNAQGDEDEEMYESSENEGAQSAEAEASPHADDGEDENDEGAETEYQENVETGDVDAGDADGDIEHYEEFADLDTSAPPQPPQFQEPIEIPDDADEELDIVEIDGHDLGGSTTQNGTEKHSSSAPDDICYCDQCLFDPEMDEGAVGETDQSSRKCEWIANIDISSDGAFGNYNAQQNGEEDVNAVDNGGFDLIEIADDDDVVGGADAAERSATATLAGDGTNEIDFGGNDLNDIANADVFLEGASADPANEIDWRDFAEDGESGLKDTLSPSVKRPRPEGDDGEELLSEGQNGMLAFVRTPSGSSLTNFVDVKRRRSS